MYCNTVTDSSTARMKQIWVIFSLELYYWSSVYTMQTLFIVYNYIVLAYVLSYRPRIYQNYVKLNLIDSRIPVQLQ